MNHLINFSSDKAEAVFCTNGKDDTSLQKQLTVSFLTEPSNVQHIIIICYDL